MNILQARTFDRVGQNGKCIVDTLASKQPSSMKTAVGHKAYNYACSAENAYSWGGLPLKLKKRLAHVEEAQPNVCEVADSRCAANLRNTLI